MDPLRILHVVGAMNQGGVESWLMNLVRIADPSRLQFDFVVHRIERGAYDDELERRGCRILRLPTFRQPLAYARHLRAALTAHGPYNAIHSHVHRYSGYVLRIASIAGVPARIAHSHTVQPASGALAQIYSLVMTRLIKSYATAGFSVTGATAADLFGTAWKRDPRWQVMPCGINLSPFHQPIDSLEVRRELGLAEDAWVIGHVGRLSAEKNHALLLKVMKEVAHTDQSCRLLLVGDGPLRAELERATRELGLAGRVIFAGARADVPRLLAAMNALVFPSLYEGLPLTLIEAQVSGLPILASSAVSADVDVVPGLVLRLGLDRPASEWAAAASSLRGRPRRARFHEVQGTPFDISHGLNRLIQAYSNTP